MIPISWFSSDNTVVQTGYSYTLTKYVFAGLPAVCPCPGLLSLQIDNQRSVTMILQDS